MRIALISDIHGNALALRAVLDDARARGAGQVACLGDVATLGPEPGAVLRILQDLGCPCILGNHDAFMLEPALLASYSRVPVIVEAVELCRAQLSSAELAFLCSFQRRAELALPGGRRLLLFHGSPDSNTEDLLATTPPDDLDHQLAGHTADVMACGHTHVQMLRQHHGSLLINPGSVGMPFRDHVAGARPTIMPYAEYAIIDAGPEHIAVELHRVGLSRAALRAKIAAWNPAPPLLQADLLQQYAA